MLSKYNRSVLYTSVVSDSDTDILVDICMERETIDRLKLDSNLDIERCNSIRDLCTEFEDVVNSEPGLTDIITHNVRTTSESPITLIVCHMLLVPM